MAKRKGCLGFLFGKKSLETDEELPYKVRDDFLSDAEFSFFKVLYQLFGDRYVICPKVSLKDLFYITKTNEYMTYFNKINRKHIDFLICENSKMKPLIGIELDDSSHSNQKRQERDHFVDEVFDIAGLPLARVKAATSYNIDELKKYLSMVYQSKKTPPTYSNIKDNSTSINIVTTDKPSLEEVAKTSTVSSVIPACPKCDISLIARKSRKGEMFYGCSNYPRCKITLDMNK